jgi:4'-phosphopantetheinyl transferase
MDIFVPSSAVKSRSAILFRYEWEKPSIDICIESDHVHIWKVNLNRIASQREIAFILSTDEQLRANRLIDRKKREKYQSSRFALRIILSNYIKLPPQEIQFAYSQNGKPYTIQVNPFNEVSFNISHSEDLMLIAISKDSPIGIDLEKNHSVSTKKWIINQYFSKNDRNFFRNLPQEDRQTAFISAWTLKEAYGKALGTGFGSAPQFDYFDQGYHSGSLANCLIMCPQNNFWFMGFSPQKSFTASAVIKAAKRPELCFYSREFTT